MELTKEHWTKKDIKEYQKFLISFENKEKREWSTNILQTKMPVLCIKTAVMKDIIKGIAKGNYLEFLDYMVWEYYENTAVNGFLISKIDDFDTRKHYLDIYTSKADNWATCDLLTFNVKNHEKEYFSLVLEYIKSPQPFVRRVGLYILFDFLDYNEYTNQIFEILDQFKLEEEYYVNMMIGWLLSELFIKKRDDTLKYLSHHNLNKFAINKGIQKCRESRRVSEVDKEMLLQFKVK